MSNSKKKYKESEEKQEIQEGQKAEIAVGPSFESLIKLTETPDNIQKMLIQISREKGLDVESRLEKLRDMVAIELKTATGETAKDLNKFKTEIEGLLRKEMGYTPEQEKLQSEREAFEERMAAEATKLDVPVTDFVEDYAREEHAAREANPEESAAIYETGVGSKTVERQIKETVLAKVIGGRDTLTGISNRVSFDQQVEKRRKEAKDRGEFSMIMIDIDKFKKVNDTYGHQAGDYVLKKVAEALKKNMRKGDMLARYGGEEMVVIAPNANGDASGFAERLRRTVKNEKIVFEGQEIKVTISAGVAPYDEDFEKMKRMSDEGLYLAKGEKLKTSGGSKVEEGHEEESTRDQVWYFDKQDETYKKVIKKGNE